jgi:hypothetical protein
MVWTATLMEARTIGHDGLELEFNFVEGDKLVTEYLRYNTSSLPNTAQEIKQYIANDVQLKGQIIRKTFQLQNTMQSAVDGFTPIVIN